MSIEIRRNSDASRAMDDAEFSTILHRVDGTGSGLDADLLDGVQADELALPPGTVLWFAATSPPAGYLECDGASISRTAYAALFSAIDTTFGQGDGESTFAIPDLRGEFIRGVDNGRGADSGRTFGAAQGFALENITGTMTMRQLSATGRIVYQSSGVFENAYTTETLTTLAYGSSEYPMTEVSFDASNVASTADETRPRNVALLPCIKY